jgi:hypothetical protein
MNSLYDFIVRPLGKEYSNDINIGGIKLILNTKIESFKFVNNLAVVVSIPLAYKTHINVGDIIVIHHNVFRTFYDIKGKKKKSRSWFKEDLYFCSLDQVYLYKDKKDDDFKSINNRCFIKPLKSKRKFSVDKEQKLIGILKIGNSSLEAAGVSEGDLVGYTPYGEYDFIINNERLYCMKSNDIVIKYGDKENQTEYNPSWANSG